MLETNGEWIVVCRYISIRALARVSENADIRLPAVPPDQARTYPTAGALIKALGTYPATHTQRRTRTRLTCSYKHEPKPPECPLKRAVSSKNTLSRAFYSSVFEFSPTPEIIWIWHLFGRQSEGLTIERL